MQSIVYWTLFRTMYIHKEKTVVKEDSSCDTKIADNFHLKNLNCSQNGNAYK